MTNRSDKKQILAICGSTRASSSNLHYINAIKALMAGSWEMTLYDGLSNLPHFNPDLDTVNPPAEVTHLRDSLRKADGVLFCTPEYAMGVPGSLKNALDWLVSSSSLSGKATALITASSMGQKSHESLLGTLRVIEARMEESTQLLIPFASARLDADHSIKDTDTLEKVKKLVKAFDEILS